MSKEDTKIDKQNDSTDYNEPEKRGSSKSSSCSSSTESIDLPTPPDGGWGWMVVFGSFMVHLIADGCAFSFGVFYVEFLDYFKESKGKTAWVGSLFVSVPLITGPIASAVTNRYGCRRATIIGGFAAGLGFVASAYVDSIEALCCTFGLVAGLGLSLVYVPAVVIVAFYFEKKRAFATGIAVAGSGIGTFLFAPLTEYLIETYSWRGAVLIIGGLMFNIMACGALFRPLTNPKAVKKKRASQSLDRFPGHNTDMYYENRPYLDNHHLQKLLEQLDEPVAHSLVQFPTYLQKDINNIAPDLLKDLLDRGMSRDDVRCIEQYLQSRSLGSINTSDYNDTAGAVASTSQMYGNRRDRLPVKESEEMEMVNEDEAENEAKSEPDNAKQNGGVSENDTHCIYENDANRSEDNDETETLVDQNETQEVHAVLNSNGDINHVYKPRRHKRRRFSRNYLQGDKSIRPMWRKDIFYRGSLVRNNLFCEEGRAASCPDLMIQAGDSSSEELEERLWLFKLLKFSKEVKHVIKEMLDVAILRSVIFVYFSLSCMLLYMWYDVPYVYGPDQAVQLGISHNRASFLVSIIGIVSTVGQVVLGYIGDCPWCSCTTLYAVLTGFAGMATVLVPFCTNFASLAAYAASFGFLISANYSLTTIILVDLLGMEKLTNSYGLIMLAEGVANLVGPPLAGLISDTTGSYDGTFYTAGVGIFISGVMLLAIPYLKRRTKPFNTIIVSEQINGNAITSTNSESLSRNNSNLSHSNSLPEINQQKETNF